MATLAPGTLPVRKLTSFRTTLLSLVVVELFSGVLQIYFTPLYPTLAAKYHVSVGTLSWALTSFTVATVVATPLFAKLGDVYGHAKILKIEAAVVGLGSILIAVAPSFPILVLGRVLQGSFAAFLPLMFGLVRHRHSSDETRRGVTYLSSVLIFGVVVALVCSSTLLTTAHGTTEMLWLPAVGVVVGFIMLFVGPNDDFRPEPNVHVDWLGIVLLAAGLGLPVTAISEGAAWGWGSALTLLMLAGGLALLGTWAKIELATAHPMVDVRYLAKPKLIVVYAVGFVVYFGFLGTQVATATFMGLPGAKLGYGLGLAGASIGRWLIPGYVIMFLAVLSTAKIGRAIGYRGAMVLGALGFTICFTGFLFLHHTLAEFIGLLWIGAAGVGFIESATRTIVVEALSEGEISIGEGIYELAIMVGSSIGAAVTAAILSGHTIKATGTSSLSGYTTTWTICAVMGVVVLIAAAGSAYMWRRRPDYADAPSSGAAIAARTSR